jgi:hypothetical protein
VDADRLILDPPQARPAYAIGAPETHGKSAISYSIIEGGGLI